MKRIFLSIFSMVCMLMAVSAHAQSKDETAVAAAVENMMNAIKSANRAQLENVAAEELVYGHSNGKVQNKKEFVDEIVSGVPFTYATIDLTKQTIKLSGDVAVVRHLFSSNTTAGENKTPGTINIGNVLVFQKQKGEWKLLARQAYPMPRQ